MLDEASPSSGGLGDRWGAALIRSKQGTAALAQVSWLAPPSASSRRSPASGNTRLEKRRRALEELGQTALERGDLRDAAVCAEA
jgi:hypothetical protein